MGTGPLIEALRARSPIRIVVSQVADLLQLGWTSDSAVSYHPPSADSGQIAATKCTGEWRGLQRKWISNLLILLTLPRVRVPSAPTLIYAHQRLSSPQAFATA
jgi:hypothetical protein